MAKRFQPTVGRASAWVIVTSALWLIHLGSGGAQVVTNIAATQPPSPSAALPSNLSLGTVVSPNGATTVITGGTHVGNGLFHSFDTFNVGTSATARFQNTGAQGITDIFAKVIGVPAPTLADPFARLSSPSQIDGTIQTAGYGNANLWFMNPSGIVFGPNAKLDVGGSATFTTADRLEFLPRGTFEASSTAQDVQGISVASVAQFGFLGDSRFQPGAIMVAGSNLVVQDGQTLTFVAGDVAIDGGRLQAPNGAVRITSKTAPGDCDPICGSVSRDPNTGVLSFIDRGNPANNAFRGTITLSQSPAIVDAVIDTGSKGPIELNGVIYNGTNATGLNPTVNPPGSATPIIVIKDGSFLVTNLPPTKLIVTSGSERPVDIARTTNDLKDPSSAQTVASSPANRLVMVSDRCAGSATGEFSSFVPSGRDTSPPQPGGLLASPPSFEDEMPQVSGRTTQPSLRAADPFTLAPGAIAFLPRSGGC